METQDHWQNENGIEIYQITRGETEPIKSNQLTIGRVTNKTIKKALYILFERKHNT